MQSGWFFWEKPLSFALTEDTPWAIMKKILSGGTIMSEQTLTSEILVQARAAFDATKYTTAADLFSQAAAELPTELEPKLYAAVCSFMAGERTAETLAPLWEQVKAMLLAEVQTQPPRCFQSAVQIKTAAAICTAAVYRSCNDHQMVEYAALNKEVKLEQKEFIFNEIQRVLLEADEQYKVCLTVMREFAEIACRIPNQTLAEEEFFLQVLSYIQAAIDLQTECDLVKFFSALDLCELACGLAIREDMTDALESRGKLLQSVLHGEAALERWDFFAPYAEAAGIARKTLEKQAKRAQMAEKLKFWKKIKLK